MAAPTRTRKLRLLCLHGMYQNGETFATKTQHLRKVYSEDEQSIEYIYVNGPFTVVPRILEKKACISSQARLLKKLNNASDAERNRVRCIKKKQEEFRAWWRPLNGPHHRDHIQLDEDRKVLMAFLHEQLTELGDIDGVMGFSQGASLASWLCSEQARYELCWSPKLAILIGSYVGPEQYSMKSGVLSDIPSLHMFGSNDHVISAAKSQQVVDIFKQAQTRESQVLTSIHTQGHVIPKCDAALAQFQSFLTQSHHELSVNESQADSKCNSQDVSNATRSESNSLSEGSHNPLWI